MALRVGMKHAASATTVKAVGWSPDRVTRTIAITVASVPGGGNIVRGTWPSDSDLQGSERPRYVQRGETPMDPVRRKLVKAGAAATAMATASSVFPQQTRQGEA